jgi:hypothetical protein
MLSLFSTLGGLLISDLIFSADEMAMLGRIVVL